MTMDCVWHEVQAVSFRLLVDDRPFCLLTVTPSYRWLKHLPPGFDWATASMPPAVMSAVMEECGGLVKALANDVGVEVLRVSEDQKAAFARIIDEAMGRLSEGGFGQQHIPPEKNPNG